MTDTLSARLAKLTEIYQNAMNCRDLRTRRRWHSAIDDAWPAVAKELNRLTALVKRLEKSKEHWRTECNNAEGSWELCREKADALAEAATKLTIELAALVLSSDEDLDIELGDIAAALTAYKEGDS